MEGRRWSIVLVVGIALLVGGCDTWMGKHKEPLPGKRLSVLSHAQTLIADPELAGAKILLPPPRLNPDWPQAGGYADHAMHHLEVGHLLKKAWSVNIGTGSSDSLPIVSQPIVADGMVFAVDARTKVSAYNAKTGARIWSINPTPENDDDTNIGGGIAFADGRVFVTTGFAQVVALNAKTGKVVWRHNVDSPMRAAPTVRGGRVFVITLDNKLYTLNAQTGETLWTYTGTPEVATLLGEASPAVDSGFVVAPFSSGDLVALTVENGRVVWTESLTAIRRTDAVSTLMQIRGRPIIDRGRVYAIGHSDLMEAIDLRSGRRIWDKSIGGMESPWIAGNYLFVLTNDWDLACLSRNTGQVFWVHSLPRFEDEKDKTNPIVWTGPILVSNRLIVAGSQGEALAISPYTGNVIGKQELPSGVSVAPIVADGTVYVLTNDAELVALR